MGETGWLDDVGGAGGGTHSVYFLLFVSIVQGMLPEDTNMWRSWLSSIFSGDGKHSEWPS